MKRKLREIPYEKSFASHPRAIHWDYTKNNDLTPKDIRRSSQEKYFFNCEKCNHLFYISVSKIVYRNQWCQYCAGVKLCQNSCDFCFNKSFATHEKSKFWNYHKNNNLIPSNVLKCSNAKFWFDCNICNHSFDIALNSVTTNGNWCIYCAGQKLCKNSCNLCFNKSFASHEKSKFWNFQMNNDLLPRFVFKSSSTLVWFDCDLCKHSFNISLGNVTNNDQWCGFCNGDLLCKNNECKFCLEKSFASNEKSSHWVVTKNNNLLPRDVCKNSNKYFWFYCDICKHEFNIMLAQITQNNNWCGYCASKILCDKSILCEFCFNKSFASHEYATFWNTTKNNNLSPREIFKFSNLSYWFDCKVCQHSFIKRPNDISKRNSFCGYCNSYELCDNMNCQFCLNKSFASHEKSIFWNLEKNNGLLPRHFVKGSDFKFWFNCLKCKKTFNMSLYNIKIGCWCPRCMNKTEQKMFEILSPLYPNLIQQFKQEWCRNILPLSFDFCIPDKKIIIELDGQQHFEQVRNWPSPEEAICRDKHKQKCANDNGYHVIRLLQLDVYRDTFDWLTELKETIEFLHENYSNDPHNVYIFRAKTTQNNEEDIYFNHYSDRVEELNEEEEERENAKEEEEENIFITFENCA